MLSLKNAGLLDAATVIDTLRPIVSSLNITNRIPVPKSGSQIKINNADPEISLGLRAKKEEYASWVGPFGERITKMSGLFDDPLFHFKVNILLSNAANVNMQMPWRDPGPDEFTCELDGRFWTHKWTEEDSENSYNRDSWIDVIFPILNEFAEESTEWAAEQKISK